MKYLIIVVLGFLLSLSTLNSSLLQKQIDVAEAMPVEISLEQADSSNSSDPYDTPSLHFNHFKYTSFFKTMSSPHTLTRYPYEKIFVLLKPPDFSLFA